MIGGADGIRTHGLLDAIEARSQLRHGPTADSTEPSLPHQDLLSALRQRAHVPFGKSFRADIKRPVEPCTVILPAYRRG